MKPITLNKNSWHYRLADKYTQRGVWDDGENICLYTKQVLKGSVWALFLTFILSFVVLSFMDFFIWLYVSISTGLWTTPRELSGFAIVIILLSACGVVAYIGVQTIEWLKESDNRFAQKTSSMVNPSFISEAYKSFKNKYCIKVEFK